VVVRINDRGPFIGGRIIDLSKAAAASIGMINSGTAKVRVTTANGGVLADLGETAAKAKDGVISAAAAKADIATLPAIPREASAQSPSKTRRVAARASASLKSADSRVKVKVAAAVQRPQAGSKGRAYLRVASVSDREAPSLNGIRAVAQQASHIPSRRIVVAADTPEPYAILGATPGFMQPSRTRLRRAG
jgi:rare lipoprotein A